MRVVCVEQCDAVAADGERRRALFRGQSYELTAEEAEPLVESGAVKPLNGTPERAQPTPEVAEPDAVDDAEPTVGAIGEFTKGNVAAVQERIADEGDRVLLAAALEKEQAARRPRRGVVGPLQERIAALS